MKPTVSIRKAFSDPKLLGSLLGDDSWRALARALDCGDGRGARRR
jgi:hypothetical protein